jgi:hypothetical protein
MVAATAVVAVEVVVVGVVEAVAVVVSASLNLTMFIVLSPLLLHLLLLCLALGSCLSSVSVMNLFRRDMMQSAEGCDRASRYGLIRSISYGPPLRWIKRLVNSIIKKEHSPVKKALISIAL